MNRLPKISLIISFFNRYDFLVPVIASLQVQSFQDFEVIISDDGSSPEIVEMVMNLMFNSGLSYQYIYHEDKGFRKTIILNKSVVASNSEYLVFLDGDCVMHKHFLREHFYGKEKGMVRTGRRVDLLEKTSHALTREKIIKGYLGMHVLLDLIVESPKNGLKGIKQGIYFNSKVWGKLLSERDNGILGCNFSMFKEDLLKVNGFDERFYKAGVGEDFDLYFRLKRTGIKSKSITKRAIVYHQYHKLLKREDDIYKFCDENSKANVTYTPYGINKE
jgi:glycosyltransferase involved in cell wall biosynthesis